MSGTVTIDDAGNASGSGSALALYNSILTIEVAANPLTDPNVPDPDWEDTAAEWQTTFLAQNVKIKRAWARTAQEHADILGGDSALFLAAAPTTNVITATNTLLAVAAAAGETWLIEVTGQVQCSASGGVKLGLGFTGTGTVVGEVDGGGAALTSFVSALIATLGTPVGAFATAVASARTFRLTARVTATTAGSITFQFASVTAAQISTVLAGTRMTAKKLVSV